MGTVGSLPKDDANIHGIRLFSMMMLRQSQEVPRQNMIRYHQSSSIMDSQKDFTIDRNASARRTRRIFRFSDCNRLIDY